MKPKFEIYGTAAKTVKQGWTQGTYLDGQGYGCLIETVSQSMPTGTLPVVNIQLPAALRFGKDVVREVHVLPADMVEDIARQLRQFNSFKLLELGFKKTNTPYATQMAIEMWNDLPWRRQAQVANVLDSTSASSELEWRRNECQRLSQVVAKLEATIKQLNDQVARLVDENGRLRRRILDARALKRDNQALIDLDIELAATMRQFQLVSAT